MGFAGFPVICTFKPLGFADFKPLDYHPDWDIRSLMGALLCQTRGKSNMQLQWVGLTQNTTAK
jgi:hypothetical protein